MGLNTKASEQRKAGFGIPADDGTVYKISCGGAAKEFKAKPGDKWDDGRAKEDQQIPYLVCTAQPVNSKTFKPIPGSEPFVQFYKAANNLDKFVPANVEEGDLDKLAEKMEFSDQDSNHIYKTLATAKGASEPFTEGSEAGLFYGALGDAFAVDMLSELDGLCCTFVTVQVIPHKKAKKQEPKDLSVPGKILRGPGGKVVEGTGKVKGKEEEEEEEEETPAPKTKGTAKAKAKAEPEEEEAPAKVKGKATAKAKAEPEEEAEAETESATDIATRLVKETLEAMEDSDKEDYALVSKKAKRLSPSDDAVNEDNQQEVLDLLGNVKWVTKAVVKLSD